MGYASAITCQKGQQILEQVAGAIGADIFTQDVALDAYTNIVEQKPYDFSLGTNQRYTVMGRPDFTVKAWNQLTQTNTGAGTTRCEPPATMVNLNGLQTKTVEFWELKLNTPVFCFEDLLNGVNAEEELRAYIQGFKDVTSWNFFKHKQETVFLGSGQKVVATTAGPVYANSLSATAYPATQPTGVISLALLDTIQQKLIYAGASMNPFATNGGAAVFPWFLSTEAISTILLADPKFRRDMNYTDQANKLVGPFAAIKALRSSAFVPILYPRRFSYAGGTFTEVVPFITSGVDDIGRPLVIPNPDYESLTAAPYEEAQSPNKDAAQELVPTNMLRTPDPMKFPDEAKTFRGEWHFHVPDTIVCPTTATVSGTTVVTDIVTNNDRHNQGYFWSYAKLGRRFPLPQRSASVIFKRCPYGPLDQVCPSSISGY